MMESRLFLDASFEVALASPGDQFHSQAKRLTQQIKAQEVLLLTTRAILLEIGNALAKRKHRQLAAFLLNALENDPGVKIVPLTDELYRRALELYGGRPDKDWGLTDCLSFVVMKDYGLSAALTADTHFQQAGFRALLREE